MHPSDDGCNWDTVLGNPTQSPLHSYARERDEETQICQWSYMVSCDHDDGEEIAICGSTSFLYKEDKERYDAGYLISVSYDLNNEEPDCVENENLKEKVSLDVMTFENQVHRSPSILSLLCLARS